MPFISAPQPSRVLYRRVRASRGGGGGGARYENRLDAPHTRQQGIHHPLAPMAQPFRLFQGHLLPGGGAQGVNTGRRTRQVPPRGGAGPGAESPLPRDPQHPSRIRCVDLTRVPRFVSGKPGISATYSQRLYPQRSYPQRSWSSCVLLSDIQ